MRKFFIIFGIVILVAFLAYSLWQYQKSGIAEDGVVTCANGQCFWSAHIHVAIPVQICGNEYSLEKFKGPLANIHTHGEENVIHWHDKLLYDPQNKVFLEPAPFALGTTLENQGISQTPDYMFGKKDGDMCDGKMSNWKVFSNGKHVSNWQDYEWSDHDIILFIFDARSAAEIEKELLKNPTKFPAIGEG
jgi:hypothetical protein